MSQEEDWVFQRKRNARVEIEEIQESRGGQGVADFQEYRTHTYCINIESMYNLYISIYNLHTHISYIYRYITYNHVTCHIISSFQCFIEKYELEFFSGCWKGTLSPPDTTNIRVYITFSSLWISEMFRRIIHNQRHYLLAQCSNISLLSNSFIALPCLYVLNVYQVFFFFFSWKVAPMSCIKCNKTSSQSGNKWCKVNLKLKEYFNYFKKHFLHQKH